MTDRDAWLGGPLSTDDLAVGSVAAELLAAADLAEARGAGRPAIALSAQAVALSFCSERHAQVGGRPLPAGFAPLSRLVRCAGEGWARTHGNYPHHAAALVRALGIEESVAALEAKARSMEAADLEERIVAAGGCAAALRSASAWEQHPAGRAALGAPLVAWGAEATQATRLSALADRTTPAAGVRVLDLTRVIAGPIAGRTLAALGAEVLRVDPPGLPEIAAQHVDTGPGKRSALLDLANAGARERLLAGADVLLVGYRSGSLDRFGMSTEELAARHPHLMQVRLSAWGEGGPWAGRRGFDSLVQVASGIAAESAAADGTPGVLPAQALDHASGYLMAAAALHGLSRRARGEPLAPARVALAATAAALLAAPRPGAGHTQASAAADPERHRVRFGDVSLIGPPGRLDGISLRWAHGPRALGADAPRWLSR